jgi:hypothetical protein
MRSSTVNPNPPPGEGCLLVNETFTTGADANWKALDQTCITQYPGNVPGGSNLQGCGTKGVSQIPESGYAQLTNINQNSVGSLLYDKAFPSNDGYELTVDTWQYGGQGSLPQAPGADGISVFLSDGSFPLTASGGKGGSLGYAQIENNAQGYLSNGIAGGYVGVGLDVWGSYANSLEARQRGCQTPPNPNPPEPERYDTGEGIPDSITIRGPGNGMDGYCYQTHKKANTLGGSLHGTSLANARRTIRLTVTKGSPLIVTDIDFHDGRGFQRASSYTPLTPPPATFKFGFSASTGTFTDYHLIDNVQVRTTSPCPVRK